MTANLANLIAELKPFDLSLTAYDFTVVINTAGGRLRR